MIKYIVASGCSLTYGAELVDLTQRYSCVVTRGLDAYEYNFALTGVSNEIISQHAINGLLKLKDKCLPHETLVIIQWTYSSRLNFCGKKYNYYTLAHHNMTIDMRRKKIEMGHGNVYFNDDFDDIFDLKFYYDQHNTPLFRMYNTVKLIHHTQSFLKQKGYRYLFLFADDAEKAIIDADKSSFKHMAKFRFEKDYIPPFYFMLEDIDKSNIFPTSFCSYVSKKNLPFGPMHHPLEQGHDAYGNILLAHIKEKFNV